MGAAVVEGLEWWVCGTRRCEGLKALHAMATLLSTSWPLQLMVDGAGVQDDQDRRSRLVIPRRAWPGDPKPIPQGCEALAELAKFFGAEELHQCYYRASFLRHLIVYGSSKCFTASTTIEAMIDAKMPVMVPIAKILN